MPARTFASLCDILDCTPNDLFEPFVEMRRRGDSECTTAQRRHRNPAPVT
ncbi:hypothetical protein [Paenarthrobacter sp. YIM B13468]